MHLTYNNSDDKICNSVKLVNAINSIKRPFVTIFCNGISSQFLYDTGADVTVISSDLFKRFRSKPQKIHSTSVLRSACKGNLKVLGVYDLQLEYNGTTITHPTFVCENLNQSAILGIDAITAFKLTYDVPSQQFHINALQIEQKLSLTTISTEKIPALSATPIKLQGITAQGLSLIHI